MDLNSWIMDGGNPALRESAYHASINDLNDHEHKAMVDDLANVTQTRQTPTGRQFLLHRGGSKDNLQVQNGKLDASDISSWTPNRAQAHRFAHDYHDTENPAHVVSAWVPEANIGIYVPHISKTHGLGVPTSRLHEHEVIVGGAGDVDVHKVAHPDARFVKSELADFEVLRKSPLMFDAETHPEEKPYVEVWRMQNDNGHGPYIMSNWQDSPHGSFGDAAHPMPHQDNFNSKDAFELETGGHKFGFESQDHLNDWFSPAEQARLATHGYKPTKVKAKKVWAGDKQVFFEPYEDSQQEKLAASEKPIESVAPVDPQPVADWRHSYMAHMKHNPDPVPVTPDLLESLKQRMLNDGHLIYDPKMGFVRNRRIKDRGNKSQPLMRAEPGSVKLIHYGKVPGLKRINPQFHGTGAPDEQIKRSGKTSVPVSYYYRAGTETEPIVTQGAKSLYHSTLGPQHKLYDLANDHQKLVHQALSENNDAWNTEHILGKIKGAGYHGFFNSKSSLPNAVALFHSHPVDKEEVINE